MDKNIRVISEDGVELASTFPKRARGLVKQGRARFVGDDTIVLTGDNSQACPPYKEKDTKMNDNYNTNDIYENNDGADEIVRANSDMITGTAIPAIPAAAIPAAAIPPIPAIPTAADAVATLPAFTEEYVLSRIDMIISDTAHLKSSLDGLIHMNINDSPNGGLGDAERARAVKSIIENREQTNRQVLDMLNNMLKTLKPEYGVQRKSDIAPAEMYKLEAMKMREEMKSNIAKSIMENVQDIGNLDDYDTIIEALDRMKDMLLMVLDDSYKR